MRNNDNGPSLQRLSKKNKGKIIKVWKDNTVKTRKKVQNNGNTKFSRREK